MSVPLIGITSSQNGIHPNPGSSYQPYFDAVKAAGGEPWIIGLGQPLDDLDSLLSRLDGLILSGGGDVQTSLYHGDERMRVESVVKERDVLELALMDKVLKLDLPLLGICRGVQVINVALGGMLITDIGSQFTTTIRHSYPSNEYPRDLIAHEVVLEPDSRLAGIYQSERVRVNSRHHQAVLEPAAGWRVAAHAPDGLIEALEMSGSRFALGVQWHPENLQALTGHNNLFKAFIAAAGV
jgi:putative glutamine amidotransferase